jgi:regulator of replication initiation timing
MITRLGDELESLAENNKALTVENARLTRELVAAQAQRDTAITGAYADRRAP